jgi:hypothetical protein
MLFLLEIEVLIDFSREGLDVMVIVSVVVINYETLADWDEESQVQDLSLCPLSDVHVICQDRVVNIVLVDGEDTVIKVRVL